MMRKTSRSIAALSAIAILTLTAACSKNASGSSSTPESAVAWPFEELL